MKKTILIATFSAILSSLNAQQQLNNSGFETWTTQGFPAYERPSNWNTLNSASGGISQNTTKVSGVDANSGNYAIKLETKSLAGQTANGIVTTGTIIITPPYGVNGGVTYTDRPDSLVGYYKSSPASGDFPTMEIVLYGTNSDTIGWARFEGPTTAVNSYTRFSAPIVYFNSNTPAKAIALFSSSNGFNAVLGSILYVDDISLVYGPVSVNNVTKNTKISVFPNPAKDFLTVQIDNESATSIQIIDETGKLVISQAINSGTNSIKISTLTVGNYVYTVLSGKEMISNGKFEVDR